MGWVSIGGTNINYPVMQSPNNPNFYLKHSFDKEYSNYGVPYVQENCELGVSDNITIYGHHMNDGSMFADLCKYESEDFYREHKTIRFDTLDGFGEYEIVAAFKTVAYSNAGFPYFLFVKVDKPEDFDDFIAKCKELAFFNWNDEYGQDGDSDHVGTVEKVEGGVVYTVEGNSGDMCQENRYTVGYYEILGYGTPAY